VPVSGRTGHYAATPLSKTLHHGASRTLCEFKFLKPIVAPHHILPVPGAIRPGRSTVLREMVGEQRSGGVSRTSWHMPIGYCQDEAYNGGPQAFGPFLKADTMC